MALRVERPKSSLSESSVTSDLPPSPDSLDLEGVDDPMLSNAVSEARRTNTMTPIVKQVINSAIQIKRLARGQDELVVSLEPKEEKTELSKEDLRKRELRKERNRVAAQKCRMKRKVKADCLIEETRDLENQKKSLLKTIGTLEEERNKLLEMLTGHVPFCADVELCANARLLTARLTANPVKKLRLDSIGTCSTTSSIDTEAFSPVAEVDEESSDSDTYVPQGTFLTIDPNDLW